MPVSPDQNGSRNVNNTQASNPQPQSVKPSRSGISFNRLLVVLLIVLLTVVAIAAFFLLRSNGTLTTQQANNKMLVASVRDENIYLEDIKTAARRQYSEKAVDQKALNIILESIIEEKLIEDFARDQKISITDKEIDEQLALDNQTEDSNTVIRENARLKVLKRKIEETFSRSREAFVVGFWIAPENYFADGKVKPSAAMLAQIEKQRNDSTPALEEIENQLKEGNEPLVIAKNVAKQYPSLQNIMTANGYFIKYPEDEEQMTKPFLYTSEDKQTNELITTLLTLKPDTIQTIRDSKTNDGGYVVNVVSAHDGEFANYTEWLETQRKQHVKIHQSL